MLAKISGYLLIAIGFIGIVYFRNYHGSLIPYPILWQLISIIILLTGFFLRYNARTKKEKKIIKETSARLQLLKEKGLQIILDIDLCEFKTNDFTDIVETQSKYNLIPTDELSDAMLSPTHLVSVDVIQTVILYTIVSGEKKEIFVSQIFAVDELTLQYYVIQKFITLYIDRFDRKNYYFELKKD